MKMGVKLRCGIDNMCCDLILSYNRIKHISDILHGWKIDLTTWFCVDGRLMKLGHSHVYFDGNPLECDCVDFNIMKLYHFPYMVIPTLRHTFCPGPEHICGKNIVTVPLDQLVCELTERCPSGCRCIHRPANVTLHVYCSNTNHSALPFELPKLPKSYTKYKPDFSNNRGLYRLEHRDYFVNTSSLDVSNCNVDSVDWGIWNDLANISQVFLDGNRLQSLPSSVAAVSLERTHFSIGRNPWKCSCDASWMSSWLKSVKHSLVAPNSTPFYTVLHRPDLKADIS